MHMSPTKNHMGPCKREAGWSESGRKSDDRSLAGVLQGRGRSRGKQMASRSWRRQAHRFSPEGMQSSRHLEFKESSETPFGDLASRIVTS